MAGLAFSDFDSLEDVLALDRFEVLIEPQGQQGLNQVLAVRCTQLTVPQVTIEQMPVTIQGMEFNFRGRRTYEKMISATFVETSDGAVTNGIGNWMESICGSESQNGSNKQSYSTVGSVNALDQGGNVAIGWQLDNLWPTDRPQIQFDGSQAQPFLQQMSFSFDRLRINGLSIM